MRKPPDGAALPPTVGVTSVHNPQGDKCVADTQEVARLKRLLDDTGAAGALFCTLLLLMICAA